MKKLKHSKEKIEKAIQSSICYADVLRKMNLPTNGGSHALLKKWITFYEIDIGHFNKEKVFARKLSGLKVGAKPLSEILVKNSTFASTHLKNRLYKEGLKERMCEKCGQGEIWKGERMALILDHIDGDNTNNELINLRILCPNCNATLKTHCRGSKAIISYGKYICGCGNYKRTKLGQCRICSLKNIRKVKNRPTTKQLKKLVSKIGYCATGRQYGVSDNAIRKWIKHGV